MTLCRISEWLFSVQYVVDLASCFFFSVQFFMFDEKSEYEKCHKKNKWLLSIIHSSLQHIHMYSSIYTLKWNESNEKLVRKKNEEKFQLKDLSFNELQLFEISMVYQFTSSKKRTEVKLYSCSKLWRNLKHKNTSKTYKINKIPFDIK